MQITSRFGFCPALVVCVIALTLGACGVKGALEAPQAGQLAGEQTAAASTGISSKSKVFVEQSRVQRSGTPDILPSSPPAQWNKDREFQPARTSKPGDTELRAKESTAPDKPFVLDWLL